MPPAIAHVEQRSQNHRHFVVRAVRSFLVLRNQRALRDPIELGESSLDRQSELDLALGAGQVVLAMGRVAGWVEREVALLERIGEEAQRELDGDGQNAARQEAARLANADSREFTDKAKRAQEQVKREESSNSRLFAVDVGLDRAALRARYPDRSRFLILKATLRPRLETQDRKTRVTGYVSELAVTQINVPHALRPTLEPVLRKRRNAADDPAARFVATVAVGQRLEPWIESVVVGR